MIIKKYKCESYCHEHFSPMIVSMFTYYQSSNTKECYPHEIWFLKKHYHCDNISLEQKEEKIMSLNFYPQYHEHEDDLIYTRQDKSFSGDFEALEKYL